MFVSLSSDAGLFVCRKRRATEENQNHKTLPKFEGVDTPENGSRPNAESELFVVENQVPADEVHRFVLFKVSLSAW